MRYFQPPLGKEIGIKYFSESLLDFYSLVDRHDKIYYEDEQGCFTLDLWT